ncbi:MAG: cysteine synthase family protein [Phycisphaerae bacterium]|nr:cysteine synthase family protein [Phycisphaerae bacterium]
MIHKDFTGLIGRTPMLELTRLEPDLPARVLAKLEMFNPMSIKDRPVLYMIRDLQRQGQLTPETELVEASSGNTAIAIAALAATMGFKAKIFMSELCSEERRKIIRAYGAEIVLTPGVEHTRGARQRGMAYAEKTPNAVYLNQHDNEANAAAHYQTTGPEIWEDCGGGIDAVVIGLGTCGTFSGLSRFFKEKDPNIRIVGFEPASSPVYSGGRQGRHKLIGIAPGFVTPNFQRSAERCDEIMLVRDEDAYEWTRRIARTEGLFVGITSGAAAKVACDLAKCPEMSGKTVICIFYDTGERYLSTEGLF